MSGRRKAERQSAGEIFFVPSLLALSTLGGLVSALMGDGAWDVAAAVGLGMPVAVLGWFLIRHEP